MSPRPSVIVGALAAACTMACAVGCGSSSHGRTSGATPPPATVVTGRSTSNPAASRPSSPRVASHRPTQTVGTPAPVRAHARAGASARPQVRRFRRSPVAPIPGRPAPRTMPDGSVVIPPAVPTQDHIAASNACDARPIQTEHGGQRIVQRPPAPGLQASIDGSHVIVDVDTGRPPAMCAPAFLVVLLTNTRGHGAVATRRFRVLALGPQHLVLPSPAYFSAAPDVVRAYVVTSDGRESQISSVPVRP